MVYIHYWNWYTKLVYKQVCINRTYTVKTSLIFYESP